MKCLTSTKAPTTVYRDHLPLLGQHYHQALQRNDLLKQGQHGLSHNQLLQYQQLEIGDRVRNLSTTSAIYHRLNI